MPAFLAKNTDDILRQALTKLVKVTPVTAVAPGSILRALAEVVTRELGDFYGLLDFNTSMAFLSSAQGRALDLLGALYDVPRKRLGELAAIDQAIGSFYFYLDAAADGNITIPSGTAVTTAATDYLGQQYSYLTTEEVVIPTGRTRVYAGIRPSFTDSVFTAGAGMLTKHGFDNPLVKCTNPKPIQAQIGFENDNAYRNRIIKAVRVAAGGTAEALRFAGLAVRGVRDVQIRQAPYGLGSFEAVVVPESNDISLLIVSQVGVAINKVRPVGVRMFLRSPDVLPLDVTCTVVFKDIAGLNKAAVARRVETSVLRYLNTPLPGQTLIYTQLVQAILDASDTVIDVVVTSYKLNGVETLRRNITVAQDEQIIPGLIRVNYNP